MKTRIEDAADEYVKQYDNEPDKSWSRLDFIAGAEFMQDEVERLKALEEKLKGAEKERDDYCEDFLKYMKSTSVEVQAHSVTREKLKVAVEALEFYGSAENWTRVDDIQYDVIEHDDCCDYKHFTRDVRLTGGKRAREALKRVKDAE